MAHSIMRSSSSSSDKSSIANFILSQGYLLSQLTCCSKSMHPYRLLSYGFGQEAQPCSPFYQHGKPPHASNRQDREEWNVRLACYNVREAKTESSLAIMRIKYIFSSCWVPQVYSSRARHDMERSLDGTPIYRVFWLTRLYSSQPISSWPSYTSLAAFLTFQHCQ